MGALVVAGLKTRIEATRIVAAGFKPTVTLLEATAFAAAGCKIALTTVVCEATARRGRTVVAALVTLLVRLLETSVALATALAAIILTAIAKTRELIAEAFTKAALLAATRCGTAPTKTTAIAA